jgi:hypothetical protein
MNFLKENAVVIPMRKTYIDVKKMLHNMPLETTDRKESCDWRRFGEDIYDVEPLKKLNNDAWSFWS